MNLPEECSSRIIDMVTKRKGEMTMMESKNGRMHLEFTIPSRGIIGLNNAVLTASAGEAIMAHRFLEYQPWKGDIERRMNGSIIAMETGQAFAYALNNLQSRGLSSSPRARRFTLDRWLVSIPRTMTWW